MKKQSTLIFFLFFACTIFAQNHVVSGKVIDAETRKPLAFVNIVINDSHIGGTTDIDGKFSFRSKKEISFLKLSYVGYETRTFPIGTKKTNLLIRLNPTNYELPEYVVLPGANPAHRIIDNAIDNRDINNPEKLSSFSYTSYDKMIFTMDLDSLPMSADTLEADTSDMNMREYLDKYHIFIMETVSERKFIAPDKNNERVVATKIAGFKNPIFVFLLSQMQSTHFYKDRISISDKNYINPISKGSTKKYFFLLQDTLYTEKGDSIFVISFRPMKNTNFDGLKGLISINSNKWAIQNVITEPAENSGMFTLRIEQLYEQLEGQYWFPIQLNTEVILNNVAFTDTTVSVNVNVGGERGTKDSTAVGVDTTAVKLMDIPIGKGKSYIRDIQINPELRNRDFSYLAVDVDPEAGHREPEFWNSYRVDTLSLKEEDTYHLIDSISKEENWERAVQTAETLFTGKIPWGKFDLDMNRFLQVNSHEGFAPGIGLHTNARFSEKFSIGGFVRYGFKDKAFKYGGDLDLMIYRNQDFNVKFMYMKDVTETSGLSFFDDETSLLRPEYFRNMLIQKMDNTEMINASVGFRALKWMKVHAGLSKSTKMVTDAYRYGISNEGVNVYFNTFDFTELSLGFRYAYKEKFIRNMKKKVSMGTKYPILWFQYTHGMRGFLQGDFDYNKYDLKIEKSFYTNYVGETSIKLAAGYVDADIPYTNLYNGNGSYHAFTILAPNSFATMRMNEFLSNKFMALYFTHDFGKLILKGKKFSPEFAIATNVGFGWLDFDQSHFNINYKTMEHGYYESGLLINNLLNLRLYSLGVGAFYRYGPYSMPNTIDNIGGKLSLKFGF
jgi:hypothetical protein